MQRDCGRPPIPKKDPGIKVEEEPLLSNHPYVDKVFVNKEFFIEVVCVSNMGVARMRIVCILVPLFFSDLEDRWRERMWAPMHTVSHMENQIVFGT